MERGVPIANWRMVAAEGEFEVIVVVVADDVPFDFHGVARGLGVECDFTKVANLGRQRRSKVKVELAEIKAARSLSGPLRNSPRRQNLESEAMGSEFPFAGPQLVPPAPHAGVLVRRARRFVGAWPVVQGECSRRRAKKLEQPTACFPARKHVSQAVGRARPAASPGPLDRAAACSVPMSLPLRGSTLQRSTMAGAYFPPTT